MKQFTWNKIIASVLIGFLFGSLLILPTQPTKAQINASQEIAPFDFQDIAWYEDKAIFTTNTRACGGWSNWMLAEKVNNAWQIVHAEIIPVIVPNPYYEVTLRSNRLRVYDDILYILATNRYSEISGSFGIDHNTSEIYLYDLKTLAYIDTISFPIEHLIHDFVITSAEQIIVLTDEGLFTYQNNSLKILKEIDSSYHELQWMTETTLCIGSIHNQYQKDEPVLQVILQYDLDTKELSTLYEGELPILDIAVAKDQTIYSLVRNPETKNIQLYSFKDGIFSLFDPVQRLSRWSRVLIDQDNQTPVTINIFRWTSPILYYKKGDSVIHQPMQFTQNNDLTLEYPSFLRAAAGEPSVLVNQGICICEDVNPIEYSSRWEDTGLKIPYESCQDIVKIAEQKYLVLICYEFCVVDSDGYRFSESFYSDYAFRKIIPYKDEYYLWGYYYNDGRKVVLQKINLEDCTLDSSPVSDFPEGPNTVFEESIFVCHKETIIKGIIKDNAFIEQEVLPVTDLHWERFSCKKIFYNPTNETFILADFSNDKILVTFLEYTEKKESFTVGYISYEHCIPQQRHTQISFLSLLNGHVSFIINECYGRIIQF